MTLNSLPFFILLALTVIIYYCLPNAGQKVILLIGGYVFYMWLRPAFGALLLASTVFSYLMARATGAHWLGKRTLWTVLGAAAQIGMLFVFKYTNFLLENITAVFGMVQETPFLTVALPIGISFFTFAISAYLFDVHSGKIEAERNFLDYAVFVAFFPTLLSGPIGRAREFLPQMKNRRAFSREGFKWGLLRFLWGMLQKVVVADTFAIMVDTAYGGEKVLSAGMWIFVVIIYSLQIYFDFAGYSNMAIGAAKMLAITVPENFNAPIFAVSIRSFWKKWHISLTSWFREYIYFSLGGSRKGKMRAYFNILVVFFVSGLWHGAAWTFIVWGLLNGLLQIFELVIEPAWKALLRRLGISEKNKILLFVGWAITFGVVALLWVFFRAESIQQARFVFGQLAGVFVYGVGGLSSTALGIAPYGLVLTGLVCIICVVVDALKEMGCEFSKLASTRILYYLVAAVMVFAVALLGAYGEGFDAQSFIYFQF